MPKIMSKVEIKQMLSKLLADLSSGKYPPWKTLDERIY